MANIQLFLENQEVELTNKVSFPLNKAFDNLWNPTDIIVEHSKSVNIPASITNNKIMVNAYRLDRQFIGGEGANIGIHLDPLKRIPMKLIYNGTILLDGYAKYTSSTVDDKQTYYTFNLYGMLGDVFQTLMDCVVDENKLTDEQKAEEDGGQKYVINSAWEERLIDKDFVAESWEHEDCTLDNLWNPHDCIGFAPAYRGLYENFESNSIVDLGYVPLGGAPNTTPKSVEEQLKSFWKRNLINNNNYTEEDATAYVDALDFESILPNGLSEHQLRQFRSYEQKPFIYFHALMTLFRNKCKELTDYEITLDPTWFSANNPYYANMCYMLDYLSSKASKSQFNSIPFTGQTERLFAAEYPSILDVEYCATATYNITDNDVKNSSATVLDPFTIAVKTVIPKNPNHDPSKCKIKLLKSTEVLVDVKITIDGSTVHRYFWGGTGTIGKTDEIINPNSLRYNNNNFIKMFEETKYDSETDTLIGMSYITVPTISFPTNAASLEVSFTTSLYTKTDKNDMTISSCYYYNGDEFELIPITLRSDVQTVMFPNTTYRKNWRNSTTCALKNLYTKDEPLFNVILQYTKMMGLVWNVDYQNKKINILTKSSYFKDYSIVDWTDKVDKSKGMTIEPISFNSKYVTFNYQELKGHRYSGYKEKYGVNYGEKKMRTKYSFDTKEEKLYKEKIYPSSISTKSFSTINTLTQWNGLSTLTTTDSEINFIDCEDEKQEKAISVNNWYFRCDNYVVDDEVNPYVITDVSPIEIAQDKYFWLDKVVAAFYGVATTPAKLPRFSPVYRSTLNGDYVGCLFNCPNEDYTADGQLANAQHNYIYDLCWSDYINERYSSNNKKLTCYIALSPIDFEKFNYKTFVVIDNQLFVVNKITDYNVTNTTTKVELIQVTNILGYTEQNFNFPQVVFDKSVIDITPKRLVGVGTSESYYTGAASLKVRSYPTATFVSLTPITPISIGTDCSVEGAEHVGNTIDFDIRYYATTIVGTEIWRLIIEQNGIQHEVLINVKVSK